MDIAAESLAKHAEWRGKLAFDPKMDIATRHDLAVAYTPGVAEPCKVIAENPEAAYDYTLKANTVAVVSDGSAVLGLGNIGPEAAMPVMEGKAALFKAFGGVDAFPICLDTQDTDEIVETVIRIAPAFGGINLEDIAAPRCFEIEARLNDALDIPVFHDDQHGTAIVVLSGIINALRLVGKDKESVRVVVNGAGSAGIAIAKLLLSYGFANVTLCDRFGILSSVLRGHERRPSAAMLEVTNLEDKSGTLADAMEGADIVIGVSAPGVITPDMVVSMAEDAIVFAMANPTPEIFPDEARAAGARVVGTGRSDFPNQVNNVIAFPGIFKGALQARAERITEPMKLAAAEALAALVSDEELTEEFIMPDPFDSRVADAVADAVRACAASRAGRGLAAVARSREHGRLRHLRGGRRRRQIDADPLPRTASGRRRPRGGAPARARGHRRGRGFARRRARSGPRGHERSRRAAHLRGGPGPDRRRGHPPGTRARGGGSVR